MACNCEKRASLIRLVNHYEKLVDLKATEYELTKSETVHTQLRRYKRLLELSTQALEAEKPSEDCECAKKARAESERLAREHSATQRKYEAYDATVKTVARLVENDTKIVEAVTGLRHDVDKILNNYDPLKK